MRLESLEIQEFGKRRDLRLEGFSPRLNVVYGPTGAGKRTTIQFIRWMLFGNCDVQCQRYLESTSHAAAGTMSLVHDGLRRTLARQNDGTRYGRLAVDGGKQYSKQTNHMVSLLGDVDQTDFDQLFSLNFDCESSWMQLTDTVARRGFDLHTNSVDTTHLLRLQQQLAKLRSQLEAIPRVDGVLNDLQRRREELSQQIGLSDDRLRYRQKELQRELMAMKDNVVRAQQDLARFNEQLSERDREVDARRNELNQYRHEVEGARIEFMEKHESELAEIDGLMGSLHGLRDQLTKRQENLLDRLHKDQSTSEQSAKEFYEICPLQPIVQKLDTVNTRISQLCEHLRSFRTHRLIGRPGTNQRVNEQSSNQSHFDLNLDDQDLQSELAQLRAEAKRLCRIIQNNRISHQYRELKLEEQHLQSCAMHLQTWLEMLESRRHWICSELTHVDQHGVAVVPVHPQIDADDLQPSTEKLALDNQVVGTVHACKGIKVTSPEADARLQHLVEQRELLAKIHAEASHRLDSLISRRAEKMVTLRGLNEDELTHVHSELGGLEVKLRAIENRTELKQKIALLEQEIAKFETNVLSLPIIAQASQYLAKMTVGAYGDISIQPGPKITVKQSGGGRITYDHLSRGIRDQLYLSLCLALTEAYAQQTLVIPLILHDVFTNIDSDYREALANVISDFAYRGHQVLIFTCHRDVVDLFSTKENHYLEVVPDLNSTQETMTPPSTSTNQTDQVRFRHHNAQDLYVETTDDVVIFRRDPQSSTGEKGISREFAKTEEMNSTQISVEVELETLIQSIGMFGSDIAYRLQGMGILTVQDFLSESPANMESELYRWGLSELPLRRWQDEISLRCWTNHLSEEEARVLIACGITDVRQLAEMDEDDLFRRVSRFLAIQENSHRYRSGQYTYNRNRIGDWVKSARKSRHKWNQNLIQLGRERNHCISEASHQASSTMTFKGRSKILTHWQTQLPATAAKRTRPSCESRLSENRESPSKSHHSLKTPASNLTESDRRNPLKFHLDIENPVTDAPSIGTKSAERLADVNIHTVADLIAASPALVAKRVAHHRINEETIVTWQRQATLVCRIPRLRGQDAQILVACGINNASELATMDADDLWKIVKPFMETNEGKRIVRRHKAPDHDKVYDWIQWAQSARSVKAA